MQGFPGIRFYVGLPVFDRSRRVAAVLSVIDYVPRERLPPKQFDILLELTRLAADRLRALEADQASAQEHADEAPGAAMLVVDDNASIVHWNTAAERLLAAYADDLFQAGAHRHLPAWDDLVAGTAPAACERVPAERPRPVSLVRADGTETIAVASVTREDDGRQSRFRVLLSRSRPDERVATR